MLAPIIQSFHFPKNMPPQSLFLSLFFTLISSSLCSNHFQGKLLADSLSPIDKDRAADGFDATSSANLQMKYEAEIVESTRPRSDHLGTPAASLREVNVDNFGAEGDGQADDTEALAKAWEDACSLPNAAVLVIPKDKKYYVKPIRFLGPCKSDSITFKILGTIQASEDVAHYKKDLYHWLVFYRVKNLHVEGEGTIDGSGHIWWQNSCKIDKSKPCTVAPTAVSFVQCDDLKVHGLNVQNSQEMHLTFELCTNVQAFNIKVTSPATSPNTDGIHVTESENVQVMNSVIQTGDDCVSIVSGSKNIEFIDVTCGPGHGISIGSLGGGKLEAQVSNVLVNTAKITGTMNGVRIKTWQGGKGFAENIVFENVMMEKVNNPIIIDQNYCDQRTPCQKEKSAVQIRNVVYKNITGTSASKTTATFNCSTEFPCQGIVQQDINLVYKAI